jgi:hypothetical protein
MGFGILFIGYFIEAIIFIGISETIKLLGCAIMLIAALKLRRYNRTFDLLVGTLTFAMAFFAFGSVIEIINVIKPNAVALHGAAKTVVFIIDVLVAFALNASILVSARAIAKDTECEKIFFGATRNFVFFAILLVLQLAAILPFPFTQRLGILAIILQLVLAFMNLYLIFRCYAEICDQSDVDMERKPSRFAFVNNYRDEMDRRRAAADAERERIKRARDLRSEQKKMNRKNKKNK